MSTLFIQHQYVPLLALAFLATISCVAYRSPRRGVQSFERQSCEASFLTAQYYILTVVVFYKLPLHDHIRYDYSNPSSQRIPEHIIELRDTESRNILGGLNRY